MVLIQNEKYSELVNCNLLAVVGKNKHIERREKVDETKYCDIQHPLQISNVDNFTAKNLWLISFEQCSFYAMKYVKISTVLYDTCAG